MKKLILMTVLLITPTLVLAQTVTNIADVLCDKLIECNVPVDHDDCVEAVVDEAELADNFTRADIGHVTLRTLQRQVNRGNMQIRPLVFDACLDCLDNLACTGDDLSVDDARPSHGEPFYANIENLIEGPCERVFTRR